MSPHHLKISEGCCKTLQLQWKVNSPRNETTQHLLIINLKRRRKDLRINLEPRILIMKILRNQRQTTTEAILMIIEQNSILSSQETQQDHEHQIQLFSFTLIGTKLSFTNCIENAKIQLNLQIFAFKTMESSILMRIYLLNLEN